MSALSGTASGVVGNGVQERLTAQGKVRIIASFPGSGQMTLRRARILNTLTAGEYTELQHWDFIPAAALELTQTGLAKLASHPEVQNIDLDFSGQEVVVITSELADRSRVVIMDGGMSSDSSAENIDEQCFCRRADGSGCCPDGSSAQSGKGSAATTSSFPSSSSAFLADRPMLRPEHEPDRKRILSLKVLDEKNRFSSIIPILSAVDWLIAHETGSPTVVLSFTTDTLLCGPCAEQNAGAQALSRGLEKLQANGASLYAPGMSAPACLPGIHPAATAALTAAAGHIGRVPGSVFPSSPAPGPVQPNGSIAFALVKSRFEYAPDPITDEVPAARTSVSLQIKSAVPDDKSQPNFLIAPVTIEAFSLIDIPRTLVGARVKVALTLAGDTSSSHWWLNEIHPIPCKELQ